MLARRMAAVLLAALMGSGLAACGDDGGSDDDGAIDQVDRDAGDRDDGDDASDDGSDDDGSGDSGSGDDADLGDIFGDGSCAEMAIAFSGLGAALTTGAGDQAEELEAFFEEAIDDVPDDLRDDFETYAEAMDSYVQAMRDAGLIDGELDPTDPAAINVLTEAMAALSRPEVQAAAENIGNFFDANCEG